MLVAARTPTRHRRRRSPATRHRPLCRRLIVDREPFPIFAGMSAREALRALLKARPERARVRRRLRRRRRSRRRATPLESGGTVPARRSTRSRRLVRRERVQPVTLWRSARRARVARLIAAAALAGDPRPSGDRHRVRLAAVAAGHGVRRAQGTARRRRRVRAAGRSSAAPSPSCPNSRRRRTSPCRG